MSDLERNKATVQAFYDQGKVVEHWDVLQVVPKESANHNTMF